MRSIHAAPMALRLFLPRQPTGWTEGIFFALDKRTAAPCAMLRWDSAKLSTLVAVDAQIAAFDFIPVCAHEPLPVGILVNVVDALAENGAEHFERSRGFGARSGQAHCLLYGWVRCAVAPRLIFEHSAYLVLILCEVNKIDLSADGLF